MLPKVCDMSLKRQCANVLLMLIPGIMQFREVPHTLWWSCGGSKHMTGSKERVFIMAQTHNMLYFVLAKELNY